MHIHDYPMIGTEIEKELHKEKHIADENEEKAFIKAQKNLTANVEIRNNKIKKQNNHM